jgi:hypothetical protein
MKYTLSICLIGICLAGAVYFYFDKDYTYINIYNKETHAINKESLLYMCLCLIPILPLLLVARITFLGAKKTKQVLLPFDKRRVEIIGEFESLENNLIEYLDIWKKNDGGTKGHALGSTLKRIRDIKKFFSDYC